MSDYASAREALLSLMRLKNGCSRKEDEEECEKCARLVDAFEAAVLDVPQHSIEHINIPTTVGLDRWTGVIAETHNLTVLPLRAAQHEASRKAVLEEVYRKVNGNAGERLTHFGLKEWLETQLGVTA